MWSFYMYLGLLGPHKTYTAYGTVLLHPMLAVLELVVKYHPYLKDTTILVAASM